MGPSNSKKTADHLIHWLRHYATTHLDPLFADEHRHYPPHIFLDFGEKGLFGLHIAREYGGLDLNTEDMLRVIEQLGAIDLTLATLVIESIQGAHTLSNYASESMKTRYLHQMASGRIFSAGAMTESDAGSNPRAMTSRATPHHHNGWVIQGHKRWVGMGASAEIIALYVQEFDSQNQWLGMSAFLVPKDAHGLEIGPESATMGLKGFAKHTLYMNQLHVTEDQRLGQPGCGMEIAQDNMMFIRLCLAAASLGAMKKCAQVLTRYASRRTIATGLLIENPVTLMRVSQMTAMIEALEAYITCIAKYHDRTPSVIPEEAFVIAKTLSSEWLNWSVDTLMRALGARGYEEINGIAKLFRDAHVFRIFEGPTEALNMYIGSRSLSKNSQLERFIHEQLQQSSLFYEIKQTLKTLQQTVQNSLFNSHFSLQYWTQSLAGEILSYGFITLTLSYWTQHNPSKKNQRALNWAKCSYQETVRKALNTTPAEQALLQVTEALACTATYTASIGDIEPNKVFANHMMDDLLRKNPLKTPDTDRSALTHPSPPNRLEKETLPVTHDIHLPCVHQLFEQQATETPDAIAISFGEQTMTYAALNEKANRVAHFLIASDVKINDIVAIYMERSIEMIIGLLGILKCGAAYLPLDKHYPPKSLTSMFQDSGARLLLTQEHRLTEIPFNPLEIYCIEDILCQSLLNIANPEIPGLSMNTICYVIYTSGSTSQPKGVMLPHRALSNLLTWHLKKIPSSRTVLQFTTLNFDMSALEIFSALCAGGQLVMISEQDRVDLFSFSQIVKKNQIETLILSVPFLKSLANASLESHYFPSLKEIIIAGEQLLVNQAILNFFQTLHHCRLYNYYGPSETHVVTAYEFPKNLSEWPEYPPIGRAIHHTKILILDENQQPVADGVSGEIYIGGMNLALGYVNQPQLTQDKFITDPWDSHPSARLYRTGDFGKIQADGNLIFLGRRDDQVKIRGFRIDLQEIEMHILKSPEIEEAVVIATSDTYLNKRLEAFIIPKKKHQAERIEEKIQQDLKEHFPPHMIPFAVHLIDQIPLTSSGKVNRYALEKQLAPRTRTTTNIIQPETRTEKAIIAIMENIFKLHIGVNNSYSSIGGNSLLAMEIVSQLQEQFSIEIPAFSLLSDPTIRDTAKRIDGLLEAHLD